MNKDAAIFRAMLSRDTWLRYGPAVREVMWTNTNLRSLYHYLQALHDGNDQDLTFADVGLYLESLPVGEVLPKLVVEYAAAEEVSDHVLREAIRQATSRGLALKAAQIISETYNLPDFDPAVAHSLLNRAVEVSASDAESSRILDLRAAGVPDLHIDRPNICSLGLGNKLDAAVGGGVAAGELCIFLAGPKRGKTSLLSFIGTQAALLGKRVMHITLENPPQMCARRYESALTGLDYDGLVKHHEVLPDAHKRIYDAGGSVSIIKWVYEDRSPSEIAPLVAAVGGTDLLIIDYLQLMVPDGSKSLQRWQQYQVFDKLGKDMCRAAVELQVPTVTAWQTTRQGSQAETVEWTDVSESWGIMRHATSAIGISASREEQARGVRRLHTLVARYNSVLTSVMYNANLDTNQFVEVR